jgi:hypothetical protein
LLRLGLSRDRVGRAVRRLPGVRSSQIVARARTAPTAALDLERSRAYYVRVFDPVGGIRITATGAERQRIRDDLLRRLPEVTDPQTGCPILVEVRPREEMYTGPYVDRMPDIVTVMRPGYGSSDRMSAYSAIATPRSSPIGDSGAHRIEGIVVLAGPSVPARQAPLDDVSIMDLAPTALYLMDVPVPEDMDGRVVAEAIDAGVLAGHPIRSGPPSARWPDETVDDLAPTLPDDDRVRERLRDLGYVE